MGYANRCKKCGQMRFLDDKNLCTDCGKRKSKKTKWKKETVFGTVMGDW